MPPVRRLPAKPGACVSLSRSSSWAVHTPGRSRWVSLPRLRRLSFRRTALRSQPVCAGRCPSDLPTNVRGRKRRRRAIWWTSFRMHSEAKYQVRALQLPMLRVIGKNSDSRPIRVEALSSFRPACIAGRAFLLSLWKWMVSVPGYTDGLPVLTTVRQAGRSECGAGRQAQSV